MAVKKFLEGDEDDAPANPVAGGGGPPYDGEMEARIAKLEDFVSEARVELRAIDVRLGRIETRLEASASKTDIQDSANATIKWIVATAALLGTAAITVITFVVNNATARASQATHPPIVITVPGQTVAPPVLPSK